MSATTKLVRREIERARKAGGMRAGMPKITIDAAVAERLVLEAEAKPPVTAELTDEQIDRALTVWYGQHRDDMTQGSTRALMRDAIRVATGEGEG